MEGEIECDCGSSLCPLPEKGMKTPKQTNPKNVISETPVNVYVPTSSVTRAPRRRVVYLRRTQSPPIGQLRGEWPMDPWRFQGSWGYIFKYETGEMWLYQREKGDLVGTLPATAALTSTDWSILCQLTAEQHCWDTKLFSEEQGEEEGEDRIFPPLSKRSKSAEPLCESFQSSETHVSFSAVWESKTSLAGRWYFRASIKSKRRGGDAEDFVLECFNSECGVFHPILNVPMREWVENMRTIKETISALFLQCRNWQDIISVKKTLSL